MCCNLCLRTTAGLNEQHSLVRVPYVYNIFYYCRHHHHHHHFGVLVTAQAREFQMFWSLFIGDCGRL